jgi:hypothetical protein
MHGTLIHRVLRGSPAITKDSLVTMMQLRDIPRETTLAFLDELEKKNAISIDGDSIVLLETESQLIDWSFRVGKLYVSFQVGTKDFNSGRSRTS